MSGCVPAALIRGEDGKVIDDTRDGVAWEGYRGRRNHITPLKEIWMIAYLKKNMYTQLKHTTVEPL